MPKKSTQKLIRIAIAEDHTILRKTIRTLLDEEPNYEVVLEADNGANLISQLRKKEVDVVLLDIEMPIMNGQEALKFLTRVYPNIKVLILSMHDDEVRIKKYLQLGAKGYLPKTCDYSELTVAIDTLFEDRAYIYNASTHAIYSQIKSEKKNVKPNCIDEPLTHRENQVLKLICLQKSHREIALELDLSYRTIENHTAKIREKTGAINSIGLLAYAIKKKIVKI